jgi:glycosyltransferase involved in cell wall biosynthesis
MQLLFISNLFPDTTHPWTGLDNATVLAALRDARPDWTIRALSIRPSFNAASVAALRCRQADAWLQPQYAHTLYVPRAGGMNDRLFSMSVTHALRDQFPAWQPDAVLASWLFPDACGVHLALPHLPQVSIAQGSDVHQYLDMPMRRQSILRLCRETSSIITRSADLAKRLVAAGADTARIHPVYNGVDHSVFSVADQAEARKELGLPTSVKTVLFVGNFVAVKGIDLLINACAWVNKRIDQPVKLVLIGTGELDHTLQDQTRSLGIDTLFAGRHNAASVARHMQAADVVCLSSINEGVPNVLLEAMACGKPVVTTDVGGIHEVVPQGKGLGHLVAGRQADDFGAALLSALTDVPQSQMLAGHARQFTWESTALKYAELLEQSMI